MLGRVNPLTGGRAVTSFLSSFNPSGSGAGARLVGAMSETGIQEAMPVFVHRDERAITEQATMRFIAFARRELELIPEWHPQFHEYQCQLRRLERRLQVGPRALRPLPA